MYCGGGPPGIWGFGTGVDTGEPVAEVFVDDSGGVTVGVCGIPEGGSCPGTPIGGGVCVG